MILITWFTGTSQWFQYDVWIKQIYSVMHIQTSSFQISSRRMYRWEFLYLIISRTCWHWILIKCTNYQHSRVMCFPLAILDLTIFSICRFIPNVTPVVKMEVLSCLYQIIFLFDFRYSTWIQRVENTNFRYLENHSFYDM